MTLSGRQARPVEAIERLEFRSRLRVAREPLWQWITSLKGIAAEMRPLLGMSAPPGIRGLADVDITVGVPLFSCQLWLFGVFPIDHLELTLRSMRPGHGFVEQSPMKLMRLWRHERTIVESAPGAVDVELVDQLEFQPVSSPRHAVAGRPF